MISFLLGFLFQILLQQGTVCGVKASSFSIHLLSCKPGSIVKDAVD